MLFQSSSAQRRLLDDVEAKTLGIRLQQLGMLLDALSFLGFDHHQSSLARPFQLDLDASRLEDV